MKEIRSNEKGSEYRWMQNAEVPWEKVDKWRKKQGGERRTRDDKQKTEWRGERRMESLKKGSTFEVDLDKQIKI